MKILSYALILSVMIWPVYPSIALATGSGTGTGTGTGTNTSTGTNTNCASSGQTYGGGSFSHCTKNDTQENSQKDTTDLNNSGAQQSMMLGMMATAAGAGMVAAGMASTPPNGGLIAAGAALIMAGMLGMKAAGNMASNAGVSDWNDYKMNDITPNVGGTNTGTSSNPDGIKIDDSFTRTGKSGLVFDEFENKTGIGRDTLADGLKSGRSIADILAESEKLKKKGYDSDKIAASMNNSGASALGADEVMGKLGLTPEELAAMANKNSSMGEDGALAMGTGGSRSPASSSSSLDGLMGGANAPGVLEGANGAAGALGGLSADVQNALDRNGITDLSIFQMVHRKYKTKTPMMFGEAARKPNATADNPFSNLGNGGKIEF
jgi:hypothetical protein